MGKSLGWMSKDVPKPRFQDISVVEVLLQPILCILIVHTWFLVPQHQTILNACNISAQIFSATEMYFHSHTACSFCT